eukprot:1161230-Pelagomonas_calceolata.AAC.15
MGPIQGPISSDSSFDDNRFQNSRHLPQQASTSFSSQGTTASRPSTVARMSPLFQGLAPPPLPPALPRAPPDPRFPPSSFPAQQPFVTPMANPMRGPGTGGPAPSRRRYPSPDAGNYSAAAASRAAQPSSALQGLPRHRYPSPDPGSYSMPAAPAALPISATQPPRYPPPDTGMYARTSAPMREVSGA